MFAGCVGSGLQAFLVASADSSTWSPGPAASSRTRSQPEALLLADLVLWSLFPPWEPVETPSSHPSGPKAGHPPSSSCTVNPAHSCFSPPCSFSLLTYHSSGSSAQKDTLPKPGVTFNSAAPEATGPALRVLLLCCDLQPRQLAPGQFVRETTAGPLAPGPVLFAAALPPSLRPGLLFGCLNMELPTAAGLLSVL